MHTLHSCAPCSELRPYVRAFAQREVERSEIDLVQPVPASLEQILEFEFRDPPIIEYGDGTIHRAYRKAVVGPRAYDPATLRLHGPVESFAIFFQPLAFWELFRIPGSELANKSYDAGDLLGPPIEELWSRMAERASFDGRVGIVEKFLLRRAEWACRRTSIMETALYVLRRQGRSRVAEVASEAALSVRQFERRFVQEMGVAPKLFSRIARFQMALDAKVKSPGRSWTDIAHSFGYHDQMHMVRSFQDLSGYSPGGLLEQLGDARPPALAASEHDRRAPDRRSVGQRISDML